MLKSKRHHNPSESGNIFVIIFGGVALVATLNFAINLVVTGPLSTAVGLGRLASTEAQLQAHSLVILSDAVLNQTEGGDIDLDGFVEPRAYDTDPDVTITGGGALPVILGLDDTDAWGSEIGYCVWDQGPSGMNSSTNRLDGNEDNASITITLISAGPNRQFNTSCFAYSGSGSEGPVEDADSDDVVFALSYAESSQTVGGAASTIWEQVGTSNRDTATDVDIVVDSTSGPVNVDVSGDGQFILLRANNILTNNASVNPVEIRGPARFKLDNTAAEPRAGARQLSIDLADCAGAGTEMMNVNWSTTLSRPVVTCP